MKKEKEPYPLLPISLIVKNRPCLVVGGGAVARRKTKSLLEAEALVTIIAPETCEEISTLVSDATIHYISRDFDEADVKDMFIVFATSDSEDVNMSVMDACRQRNIPCCSVDGNWRSGDFVSPASFRKDNITISVSTGGQSCTRARDIKNMIAENLDNLPESEKD